MAQAKVVTLDQVEAGGLPNGNFLHGDDMVNSLGYEDNGGGRKALQSSASGVDDDLSIMELEEAKDKVYPMPENWPKISRLEKRSFSFDMTNIRTTSVHKAVSHIELIQNIIDEWFKRASEEIKSRMSSRPGSMKGVHKQLRFQDAPLETELSGHESTSYKPSTASRMSSSRLSSASTRLSVTGRGAVSDAKDEIMEDEVPYLGAQDVIDEVMTLLAKLDCERQEAQEKYEEEIIKAQSLKAKIDELELRKLRELPMLVQREHEACIMDVNELHWHVSYTTRNEAKAQNRFTIAERLNNQLKEDIAFVKQHVPLVQEKLILEVEAMDKIRKAQGETDQELVTTKQRQAKTEMKSTEAINKAETERGHIKKELDTVRDNLSVISDELTEAKMTFSAFVHQVSDIHQQLGSNDQELKVLRVKNENARTAEDMQATKVRDLQAKISEAEFNYRQLETQNAELEQKLASNRRRHNQKLQDLSKQFKALEGKLLIISRKNQDLSSEIEDTEEKIKKCEKQKVADEKNITRINREIERTANMLHHTMEEHNRISSINHHIRDQLESEEDKAYRTEETLKQTAETLRRQVKDEIHTRTVLQARINADTAEMEKVKGESAKKKGKAKSVADDVETAVNQVTEKVEKLRAVKEKNEQQKEELSKQIEETLKQHQESSSRFHQALEKTEPHHKALKEEIVGLEKQIEHMDWRTDLMNKKIEEMDAAQGMMERSVKTSDKAIVILSSELEELNLQIEAGKKIEEALRKEYNATCERLRHNGNKHVNLLKDRKDVLTKHENDKNRYVNKNKELASRYRQLQNDFVISKEQMLRSYDERVKFEAAITDTKQLKSLQTKLHGALAEYYKLSGLYNEAELSKLEQESSSNGVRVSELQVNMETALEDISDFLGSQMDGKVARDMAWEAVKRKSILIPPGTNINLPSKTPPTMVSKQLTEMSA